jgi:hypothetical protein
MVKAVFKTKGQILTVVFPREELAKRLDLQECVLSFGLVVPIQHEGRICRFVVFPVIITPELELKQVGEGILCADEAEATETRNEIQELKKQKTPAVVLASWDGGFALSTISDASKLILMFKSNLIALELLIFTPPIRVQHVF